MLSTILERKSRVSIQVHLTLIAQQVGSAGKDRVGRRRLEIEVTYKEHLEVRMDFYDEKKQVGTVLLLF